MRPAHTAKLSLRVLAPVTAGMVLLGGAQHASADPFSFVPGDLVVSGSYYPLDAGSQPTISNPLPGGGTPSAGGAYPGVFNNNTVDGSFGVTTPIFLNQFALSGNNTVATAAGSLNVTAAAQAAGIDLTTSFSSKSELAINLTPSGSALTFMGYNAPVNQLDVSNSNTPGVVDSTNPVKTAPTDRAIIQVGSDNAVSTTLVNSYSGNNGRAAILGGNGQYYTVGNAGNGGNPQPAGVVAGAGVQVVTPGSATTTNIPGPTDNTALAGSFSVTQTNPLTGQPYSATADKAGKDNNYRGETIFNNTLFVTKGSGGNGIDTIYQVGTAGSLPGSSNSSITVLPGFPAGLAKTNAAGFYPFGIWFANATTLYVADEGDGTMANAGTDTGSGLQKWTLNTNTGLWSLAYTLQAGLGLGVPYTVATPQGDTAYPTIETDGLRNITGEINADGSVTIFALTSTVSSSGDQGADPNELVSVTDNLAATSLPGGENFNLLQTASYGEVLRGVSEAPVATPEPASMTLLGIGLAGLLTSRRRR